MARVETMNEGLLGRRALLRCGAALALPAGAGLPGLARAQAFPSRPITLLVAFAPGGAGDIISRRVAQKMSQSIGQQVVVENRPGAGAVGAAQVITRGAPDGHTMLLTGNGMTLSSVLFKNLPYNLQRDFRPVSTLALFDLAFITASDGTFKSLNELLAWARGNPGKLSIGSARVGSTQHLAAEMFKSMAAVDATIVPYKSSAEMISGLRTKDIQVAVEIVPPILGQITGKSVRALAVAAGKRFPGLPDVPTVAESGVPGFEAASWAGLAVHAGTPQPIVDRLAREIQAAVDSPDVREPLQAMGYLAVSSTPEQMAQRISQDMAKWKAVIDKAGIPLQ